MTITQKHKNLIAGLALGIGVAVVVPAAVFAAETADSELKQEITAGALSTDIVNASGSPVNNPAFNMSQVSVSNSAQQSTGVFGSDSQRILVDNPGGADGGWTLAWNATDPGVAEWTSGSDSYKYNDSASSGQLTVDPSAGSITAITGGNTGVSLGSSASFSGGDPITLMSASGSANKIWKGYVTDIDLSQSVPASTPAGNYSIDMTQTVTAN